MQELGTPVEQLLAYVILGITAFVVWWLDRTFDKKTKFQIIISHDTDEKDTLAEKRRLMANKYVKAWWAITLLQTVLVGMSGYLIFRIYGAVTLFVLFAVTRVIPGLFHMRVKTDPLDTFEKTLEMKAALTPFSEAILRLEIERHIQDGILKPDHVDELVRHLSRRDDVIGESAQAILKDGHL